jgi:hypothetical protein
VRDLASRKASTGCLEHALVASDLARIYEREQELGISFVDIIELPQLTNLVADRQAQIPERLQQRVDELLLGP